MILPRIVPALTALVVMAPSWLALPDRPSRADEKVQPAKDAGELALTGLDPVPLTRGQEIKGDAKFVVVRKGLRYLFANEQNRAAFEKEPERYEIQNDGQCTSSPVTKGDPSVFAVHKGKIYVFFCEHCRAGFLKAPDEYTKPRKNVAIFVHDGVELLDFAGPGEVFAAAGSGRAFKVFTVAAGAGPITSQGFLKVTPSYTFADCPKPDIIVLPGGATGNALKDERVVEWVKKASSNAEVTLSVCTGAFILGRAGLLDGKNATTHWASIERLKKEYPKTTVHADKRFVDNGKIVTSAGVSAGIDASLHVVEKLHGKEEAEKTARYMQYRREAPGAK
ncbi:DJ-1/PfpI family protein [Gemmata sp. G18]|uniref:DJ-1/PfpI family protein n=1 Tax=Gemmata palustris TaxID=2822762 RepID=A0ABS5BL54_9BACT|nr:DJ-1/PfpI family protein [Gemmata palustris]MBP3954426.1 DJ-1/PfpI family protein [Gemmata palustris]